MRHAATSLMGPDSEYLVASITSPLALKQPTQELIAPEDRVSQLPRSAYGAIC